MTDYDWTTPRRSWDLPVKMACAVSRRKRHRVVLSGVRQTAVGVCGSVSRKKRRLYGLPANGDTEYSLIRHLSCDNSSLAIESRPSLENSDSCVGRYITNKWREQRLTHSPSNPTADAASKFQSEEQLLCWIFTVCCRSKFIRGNLNQRSQEKQRWRISVFPSFGSPSQTAWVYCSFSAVPDLQALAGSLAPLELLICSRHRSAYFAPTLSGISHTPEPPQFQQRRRRQPAAAATISDPVSQLGTLLRLTAKINENSGPKWF